MGYSTFKGSPKAVITGDQIGPGQISLSHLDPGLFSEIKNIALHSHTGARSRRINLKDLEGSFGIGGFYMYDTAGTRYHVTISAGAFVLTAG
jgi:hypothetical protein